MQHEALPPVREGRPDKGRAFRNTLIAGICAVGITYSTRKIGPAALLSVISLPMLPYAIAPLCAFGCVFALRHWKNSEWSAN